MKKHILLLCSLSVVFSLSCRADDDDFGAYEAMDIAIDLPWFNKVKRKILTIPTVKFAEYNIVCGECHFAYQPALLPQKAWQQTLKTKEHFGQVLAISDVQLRTMRRYVIDNSADHVSNQIAEQISLSLKYHETDGRVTSSPFFTFKHKYVKIQDEKKIQQCDSCHSLALQGDYEIEQP